MATETKTDKAQVPADEVERLRAENARLREELAEARANAKPQANTSPETKSPSFGISEGTRRDLEAHGKTVDPFTGDTLTGGPDDYKRESRKAE